MNDKTVRRILTIDQGNSSAKVVVWTNGNPSCTRRMNALAIEELIPVLGEEGIDGCAYCSVCHTDAKFLETLRRLVDGRLLVLTPSVNLPVSVYYGSRSTLGSDRVAAAMGARALLPGESALVVDAGTAVTIDVIDRRGNFMGGNIAPGMHLRFKSLNRETQQLPLVEEYGELPPFGVDTESAIRCGVVGGMVSEIADAYNRARDLYGCSRIVLAGSDSLVLDPLLRARGLPTLIDPNLVGRGLVEIYEYNTFDRETC